MKAIKIFLLSVLLAQLPYSNTWADNVAKVGSTEYATIQEAIAAWGPGKTLTLLDNVTCDETVKVEVNASKSTQNWTLDLGDYQWTANGCHAFQLYASGTTAMNQNYGLKVYANQGGGITATGKYCIQCTYETSSAGYRPRLEVHGGTYTGSYIVYYQSLIWNNNSVTNGPSTHIFKSNDNSEPVFNGNFALAKCPIRIYAGYFNGTSFNTYPVGTTADTYLYGGHFKSYSAFPSANNNKGIIFDNYKVFVNDDASIDISNGAPAEYEAKATKSLLLTANQAVKYNDYVYYEKADDAITKYTSGTIDIILSEGVTATKDKSYSSGTLTIDISAPEAAYTGKITLTGKYAKFVIKYPEGKSFYGVTTTVANGQLHIEETMANGIVTRTYTVLVNVSEANAEAQIDGIYYSSIYDAFYAIDGNTENKTIKLMKDVSNAIIMTNGKAANAEDGKTVVTFDLNGHSLGVQSTGTSNEADYTLTVIDSSEQKTGMVTNTTSSLWKIALTGDNDFSGKYTLIIQGGTWHFDPTDVTYNSSSYNLVDEGYWAHDNGNGTWTVDYSVALVSDNGNVNSYNSFDNALAAITSCSTITLVRDVTLSEDLTWPKDKGEFTLIQGSKSIHVVESNILLPTGVTITTDKNVEIFAAASDDAMLYVTYDNDLYTLIATVNPIGQTIDIPVGKGGYRTLCSPVDLDFTSWTKIKAYMATNYDNGKVSMHQVLRAAAGEGLVLMGNEGAYETLVEAAEEVAATDNNLLVGVLTDTFLSQTEGNYTNYVIGENDDVWAFYKVKENGGTLAAGKSYLQLDGANAARINFVFEETTGISVLVNDDGEMDYQKNTYDLQGRRISNPRKGIYIRNGHRVVFK